MSDTRFIIIGIGLIFSGFILIGVLGADLNNSYIQENEFEDCYQYFEDQPPLQVDCEAKNQEKNIISVTTIGLILSGILSLVKGMRGDWDAKVKPEEMVGPGGDKPDITDSDEFKNDKK